MNINNFLNLKSFQYWSDFFYSLKYIPLKNQLLKKIITFNKKTFYESHY